MTALMPEILLYKGQKLALCDQPLYPYLTKLPKARRPKFAACSTACRRGYVGTWEIRDGWLYLISIEGSLETPDGFPDATLKTAFPWVKETLLAKWFSETVRCPEGRMLSYAHAGYASEYERDRMFYFEKGQLIEEFVVLNPPLPIIYHIAPDGSRTCVEGLNSNSDYAIEDPLKGEDFSNAYKVWGQPPEGEEPEGYFLGGDTSLC